jgi:hypothetical protein
MIYSPDYLKTFLSATCKSVPIRKQIPVSNLIKDIICHLNKKAAAKVIKHAKSLDSVKKVFTELGIKSSGNTLVWFSHDLFVVLSNQPKENRLFFFFVVIRRIDAIMSQYNYSEFILDRHDCTEMSESVYTELLFALAKSYGFLSDTPISLLEISKLVRLFESHHMYPLLTRLDRLEVQFDCVMRLVYCENQEYKYQLSERKQRAKELLEHRKLEQRAKELLEHRKLEQHKHQFYRILLSLIQIAIFLTLVAVSRLLLN